MTVASNINLNICYGCMKKLEEGQQICSSCGYDSNTRQNGEDVLPERYYSASTSLAGSSAGAASG